MPLKLRPEWLGKIRPPLIDGIKEIKVKNGMFLDKDASLPLIVADFHIPKTSPVRRELENLVDEFPLVEFVLDTLDRELYDRDKYNSELEQSLLTDIEGYENAESVADRLLLEFQTLPWEYLLAIRLPDGVADFAPEDDFEVSEDIWLRRGSESLEAQTPLANLPDGVSRRVRGRGLLSFALGPGPGWNEGALYLQMRTKALSALTETRSPFGPPFPA